jgi:hypothetical protein
VHLYGIDLRIQDAFLFAQWASDEFTVRIHNHTVAEVDSLIDIRVCGLGLGWVTVRFETKDTPPGPVWTLPPTILLSIDYGPELS